MLQGHEFQSPRALRPPQWKSLQMFSLQLPWAADIESVINWQAEAN